MQPQHFNAPSNLPPVSKKFPPSNDLHILQLHRRPSSTLHPQNTQPTPLLPTPRCIERLVLGHLPRRRSLPSLSPTRPRVPSQDDNLEESNPGRGAATPPKKPKKNVEKRKFRVLTDFTKQSSYTCHISLSDPNPTWIRSVEWTTHTLDKMCSDCDQI